MFRFTVAFVALLCLGTVFASHLPIAQLGTFEGQYDSPFGLGMYLCQDGDFVYGYSDQTTIIRGTLTDGGEVLRGNFFQAGTGPCSSGTVELDHTSWGVEGVLVCRNGAVVPISAVKQNAFRPSDYQCARLSTNDDLDLEGRYFDNNLQTLDLCFRDPDDDSYDDDDETVQASLTRVAADGTHDQFLAGNWHADGKIFTGTWYENFNAGAVMFYLRNDGSIDTTYWTGLFKTEGETYIDGTHSFDSTKHWVTHWNAPRTTSLASRCVTNESLEYVVRTNLRPDDDDNYYYFVDTIYFDEDDIQNVNIVESSSASIVISSFVLVALGLLAVMF